ncbi:hypothetical protein LXL04_031098 [Taraxacum kok-saghyz]
MLWHNVDHMESEMCGSLIIFAVSKKKHSSICELGKQSRKSHSSIVSTKIIAPLELLHIDLCGPSSIESLAGNKYILVIVDDFSRFTGVYFLKKKSQTTQEMIDFIKYAETKLRKLVRSIRSDNGTEFKNKVFVTTFQPHIHHLNMELLNDETDHFVKLPDLPLYFWADAILTACFTQNRSYINKRFNMTPYEIINNRYICTPPPPLHEERIWIVKVKHVNETELGFVPWNLSVEPIFAIVTNSNSENQVPLRILWVTVAAILKAFWDARNDKVFKNNLRSGELPITN